MTKQTIIEYVLKTPFNTNRQILMQMLNEFEDTIRGEVEPEDSTIIYDGGQIV